MKRGIYFALTVGALLLIFELNFYSKEMPAVQMEESLTPPSPSPTTVKKTSAGSLVWTAPASWKPGKTSSMRIGSYSIDVMIDGGKEETLDLSIIKLRGNGGGDLPNLNRWRGQVGLNPVTPKNFANEVTKLQGKLGEFLYVKIINPQTPENAMLATMMPAFGDTVYIKLTGTAAGVTSLEQEFKTFASSLGAAGGADGN